MRTVAQTTEQLTTVLRDLADVVDTITPQHEGAPTPCSDYDVAALRDHTLRWLTCFADGFTDPEGTAPDPDALSFEHSGATVRRAADRLVDALRAGAAERPLSLGGQPMPGEMAASMILWEYVTHGWDLARALGRPWAPPAGAVESCLSFAPGMLTPDFQGEGKPFAPPVDVPTEASPLDRLLGLSGRDPAWRA